MRIVGLNSEGMDTILTVISGDGCKSLYYFYRADKLLSVIAIKTSSPKGSDIKIGKDFIMIRPNNHDCKQQLIYVVDRYSYVVRRLIDGRRQEIF